MQTETLFVPVMATVIVVIGLMAITMLTKRKKKNFAEIPIKTIYRNGGFAENEEDNTKRIKTEEKKRIQRIQRIDDIVTNLVRDKIKDLELQSFDDAIDLCDKYGLVMKRKGWREGTYIYFDGRFIHKINDFEYRMSPIDENNKIINLSDADKKAKWEVLLK